MKALTKLYPELKLKKDKFYLCKDGWNLPQQRRKFFDDFAKSKQFDPLDAERWYSIEKKEIRKAGGNGIINYYKRSYITALVKLYPELKLKKDNFLLSNEGWKSKARQRKFFDDFAKSKQFDPLDAEKWYSITRKEISINGGRSMLKYYNGSHIEALTKLYPGLMLKKKNFFLSDAAWKSKARQRNFFDELAKSKHFNPLDAEKWLSITQKDIQRAGGGSILKYYQGSHSIALKQLYPEFNGII